jgi:hypothetical protein
MECVITVVRGNKLEVEKNTCQFCCKKAVAFFGITKGKKHDGTLFKGFGICEDHKNKLNSILSGEFDIDYIYSDRINKLASKTVKLRYHPPIQISKTNNKKTLKTCAYPGCSNTFYGIAVQKYCNDDICKEKRKKDLKNKKRKQVIDKTVSNIIIDKKIGKRLNDNQILKMQCRAKDINGNRCKNTFTIEYQNKRTVYRKFCDEHTSSYKRQRFSLQRGKKCQSYRYKN